MTSTHWAENLFDDNVEVVSNDGQSTIERGGILTWRLFAHNDSAQILHSLNTYCRWCDTEWKEAKCAWLKCHGEDITKFHPNDGICPHQLNLAPIEFHSGCGFYSFKTFARVMQEWVRFRFGFGDLVNGYYKICPVLIGGRVIEHVNGYRSSRMRLINPQYPHAMSVSDAQAYAESIGASFEKE